MFDIGSCTGVGPQCGNNIAEGLEPCDGTDLNNETCNTVGYAGGILACQNCELDTSGCTGDAPVCGDGNAEGLEECDEYDLSECTGSPIRCGNGRAQGVEQCDGADLRSRSCEDLGYADGVLACNENCSYDVDACAQ